MHGRRLSPRTHTLSAALATLLLFTGAARAQTDSPAPAEPAPGAAAPAAPAPAPAPAAPAPAPKPAPAAPVAAPKPAPAPAAPPPKAAAAPAPSAAPAPAGPAADDKNKAPADETLMYAAKSFYARLQTKDVEGLTALCHAPFFFEGTAANGPDDVRRRWTQALGNKSLEGVPFYGIEAYTPEELTAKHGKPPEKLAVWPMKGGMLTVGNLGGRAALVLWKKNGKDWQAWGYHD